MQSQDSDPRDNFDTHSAIRTLQVYKVRFLLLVFLISGFLIHLLIIEMQIHSFLGFPSEFYEKLADAIIIAAIVGITYEWYAKEQRTHELRKLLRNTMEDLSSDNQISKSELKSALSQISSSNDIAMFTILGREEGTELVRNRIECAEESIKIIGGFRTLTGEIIDESAHRYHEVKRHRLRDDSEIAFHHLCDCEGMTKDWLDTHIQLFEAAKDQDSQYSVLHFDDHPTHMSIIIIDDKQVIIDLKDDRTAHEVKDTELVLSTSHEKISDIFSNYFDSIYDNDNAIKSAEEIDTIL